MAIPSTSFAAASVAGVSLHHHQLLLRDIKARLLDVCRGHGAWNDPVAHCRRVRVTILVFVLSTVT